MGWRSRAQKIIESIDDDLESEYQYLVIYDFIGKKRTNKFWNNMNTIIVTLGGEMLQYSVYLGPVKGALAVSELVTCYGGEAVVFAVLKDFGRTYVRNNSSP